MKKSKPEHIQKMFQHVKEISDFLLKENRALPAGLVPVWSKGWFSEHITTSVAEAFKVVEFMLSQGTEDFDGATGAGSILVDCVSNALYNELLVAAPALHGAHWLEKKKELLARVQEMRERVDASKSAFPSVAACVGDVKSLETEVEAALDPIHFDPETLKAARQQLSTSETIMAARLAEAFRKKGVAAALRIEANAVTVSGELDGECDEDWDKCLES